MKTLIAGGKHDQSVPTPSLSMRPGTRGRYVGGHVADAGLRWPHGLPMVTGPSVRHAPSQSRPTVHHALRTTERSLRSRTGARSSRYACSRFDCVTPKHELKRIAYFDLLESFAKVGTSTIVSLPRAPVTPLLLVQNARAGGFLVLSIIIT